ncbi:hypothetical protein M513_02371 [Trichuris suis]|uniref:WAP domain-containing protein n=1 Tax=Trichuris suis TaxID=68888 RepID=A0A085MHJ9_9BILA|nr:hypothetical protein M513_02371 [Trichuris suis]
MAAQWFHVLFATLAILNLPAAEGRKTGSCPKLLVEIADDAIDRCDRDENCEGRRICCPTVKGRICMAPIDVRAMALQLLLQVNRQGKLRLVSKLLVLSAAEFLLPFILIIACTNALDDLGSDPLAGPHTASVTLCAPDRKRPVNRSPQQVVP